MAYNPNSDPYFQQVLSGQNASSGAPPTSGGNGALGTTLLGAGTVGGLALAPKAIKVARSAWSSPSDTPESALQNSGATTFDANPVPVSAGEGANFPGLNTINPELLPSQGGSMFAGAGTGADLSGVASTTAPDLATGSLGAILGAAAPALVLGGDSAPNSVQQQVHDAGLNKAKQSALAFFKGAVGKNGQIDQGTLSLAMQYAGAINSRAKQLGRTGQSITVGDLPKAVQTHLAQQTQAKAQKLAGSYGTTVSNAGDALRTELTSNGIDPYGSTAKAYIKDLTSKAVAIDKAGGSTSSKSDTIQKYTQSLVNNLTQQQQATAYEKALPQANQTAYTKMMTNALKPYLDSAATQNEQSVGQLLQLAHSQAQSGNKTQAAQLLQQAQQMRTDNSNQAAQMMSLALSTPRVTAYQNQLNQLTSQLSQYNNTTGASSTSSTLAQLLAGSQPGQTTNTPATAVG